MTTCDICKRPPMLDDAADGDGPPVDLARCASRGGFECRAVAMAVARATSQPSELSRALAFLAVRDGAQWRPEEIFRRARERGWTP